MSKFDYSKEEIEELKNQFGFSKVSMQGFYDDLAKLKEKIEELYNDNVFYLGCPLEDAPYHGWTGDTLKEMREIDGEVCKRFKEIYAIILCGLGE